MKIDPKLISVVANMNDQDLWTTVRSLAGMKKIRLRETPPSHETLDSLRQALMNADKMDLGKALGILKDYKEKNK